MATHFWDSFDLETILFACRTKIETGHGKGEGGKIMKKM